MSQHDFDLANQSGAGFRADLNLALLALVTQSAGSSAPSTTYPFQYWVDTSGITPALKIRDATNTSWVTVGLTGDVSTSGFGAQTATIGNGIVTNAMLANVATNTIKGRISSGTGSPEDLTPSQVTSMMGTMVGDSGSGGVKGLVPAPGSGDTAAGKYLKADGTWTAPPSGRGSVGQQLSSAINFNTTSTSYVNITNASVTITTTGRPVFIGLMDDGSGTGSYLKGSFGTSSTTYSLSTKFVRDGSTTLATMPILMIVTAGANPAVLTLPSSAFWFIDTGASAASHTYTMQMLVGDSNVTGYVANAKLVAFEIA